MRFFLRLLLLPIFSTLYLQAPAHAQAQAQAQTLKMTTIYNVSLGMSLDVGISTLREADFYFWTTPSGDIKFKSETAKHYEGKPEFIRSTDSFLDSEHQVVNLIAMRVPDAAEDEWTITAINLYQSYIPEDSPRHERIFTHLHKRIGVDQATCSPTNDKWESIFAFNSAGDFIASDGASDACSILDDSSVDLGDFVVIKARPSKIIEGHVNDLTLTLVDGTAIKTQFAIREGSYGKAAPTIGDF